MQNFNTNKAAASFSKIAETLKAAAHAERLAILHMLGQKGAMHVKNIYSGLKLEQSTVSRHLGILKRSGILNKAGSGNNSTYMLNMENPITTSMIHCLQHK